MSNRSGVCGSPGCTESAYTPHRAHMDTPELWAWQSSDYLRRARYGRLGPLEPRPRGVDRTPREQKQCSLKYLGLTKEERREGERLWHEHFRSCRYCWGNTYAYRDGERVKIPPPGLEETTDHEGAA